jgi:ketosteroid isomerase-like protein
MGHLKSAALLSACALAVALGACMKAANSSSTADITQIVKADEKKWNADFKSKDLEALLGHYSNDAYFVAPGVKPANGSTEIRKAYADGMSDQNFAISFAADKIDVGGGGDMAYARGRFTEKFTDPRRRR